MSLADVDRDSSPKRSVVPSYSVETSVPPALLAPNSAAHFARSSLTPSDNTDGVPFWELPTLGGAESLRAFGERRYYGPHSMFASLEIRVQAAHMVLLGVPVDVELAPFLDAGQVFGAAALDGRFNWNPGLSVRLLNRPNIGLIISVADGEDGTNVTGGVSLPL